MRLVAWLAERLGFRERTISRDPGTHFVYVKIPDDIGPLDRGERYEDPIQESLDSRGLGDVTGGGSQLGDERPDGTRPIEFCGLDLELVDLDEGRALLRSRLVELGAPEGTELHYTIGDTKLQDELRHDGWLLDRPRRFLHPGFGT